MAIFKWFAKRKPRSFADAMNADHSAPFLLEPRYLYDASGVSAALSVLAETSFDPDTNTDAQHLAESADGHHADADTFSSALESVGALIPGDLSAADGQSVIVVDPNVANYQQLLDLLGNRADVYVLDASRDGMEQIQAILASHSQIDSLHVISHGSDDSIQLGSTVLTSASIRDYETTLNQWGESLTADADILFYGCSVAESTAGQQLFSQLAKFTGADVAASIDTTGAAALGGDWDLEYQVGQLETAAYAVAEYDGLLDETETGVIINKTNADLTASATTEEDIDFDFEDLGIVVTDDNNETDFKVTVTVDSGLLTLDGYSSNSILFDSDIASIDSDLAALTYSPVENASGAVAVTIRIDDLLGDVDSVATREFNLTVTPHPDAPTLSSDVILDAVAEDSDPAVATVADLFAAPNFSDVDEDTLAGLAIVADGSTSDQGAWEYKIGAGEWTPFGVAADASAVAANNALLLSAETLLRFNPADDYHGAVGSLTVRAIDSSTSEIFTSAGSASYVTAISSTDFSEVNRSLGIGDVTAVNDAPTTEGFTLTTDKNVTLPNIDLTVHADDIDGGNNDTTDAVISGYTIVTIPTVEHGVLQKADGTTLAADTSLTTEEAANLKFVPVLNYTGDATFTFQAIDAAGEASESDTVTITVEAFNEPPVVSAPATKTVAEDAADVTIGGITITDTDAGDSTIEVTVSTNEGGTVSLSTMENLTPQDGTTNGSATVTVQGTLANINLALFDLKYNPADDYNGEEIITVAVDDLVSGDAKSDSTTITVTVTPEDDTPLTGDATLAAVSEDNTNPPGATVANLLSNYSDVDDAENDNLAGIAISTNPQTASEGIWQYSVDDGSTWSAVGTVSTTNALLLDSAAKLRFLPAAEYHSTVTGLTIHAIDDSGSRTFTDGTKVYATSLSADDLDPTGTTLNTSISDENDLPEEITAENLVFSEGASAFLTSAILEFSDVESAAGALTYTIDNIPEHITVKRGETVLNSTDAFTQAEINAGDIISFTHDGTEPSVTGSSLTFGYTLSDEGGYSEARSLTINVAPVNDAPELTIDADEAHVDQGSFLDFSTTVINVYDPDNSDSQLTFKLASLPTYGKLTLNGAPLAVGSIFSYSNIGQLRYTHDDGDATADTFTITLRDGAGGTVGEIEDGNDSPTPVDVTLTIDPVNSVPTLSGDQVWQNDDSSQVEVYLTLDEGASAVPVLLYTTFADYETTNTADLTIELVDLPQVGEAVLRYYGDIVDAGFTFSANNKGLLTIDHISAEQENPPDVSFNIKVTDTGVGDGNTNPLSTTATVIVEVQPINDHPTVPEGIPGTQAIDEGSYVTISTTLLDSEDVDTADKNLTFSLETIPSHGYLFLDGVPLGVGATFTLPDIEANLLVYQHAGSSLDNDTFSVTLRDGEGGIYYEGVETVLTVTFTINDTDESGADETYDNAGPIGDSGTIIPADGVATDGTLSANPELFVTNEDTSINISVASLLANDSGKLPLNITSVVMLDSAQGSVAMANDIITFIPTANFNGFAKFEYTVEDNSGDQDTAIVTVMVLAQHDEPFLTVGIQRYHLDGTTLFSEGDVVTVTSAALDTTDVDNPSFDRADFIYTLTELPDKETIPSKVASPGVLFYDNGVDSARELRINDTFTQEDLDEGYIKFYHNGLEEHTATFKFTVTDGSDFVSAETTATLIDTPVNDAPHINDDYTDSEVVGDELIVQEHGTEFVDEVYIKTSDVDKGVDGNFTDVDSLSLSISDLPDNGTLELYDGTQWNTVISGIEGTTFTQADVEANHLRYVHGDNELTSDSFTVTVMDNDGATDSAVINVGIVAVNDDPTEDVSTSITVYEGQYADADITAEVVLEAGDSDNTTDQRQFRITSAPAYGKLLRDGVVLCVGSSFTQADLDVGLIHYQHDGFQNFDADIDSVDDSFSYIISDAGGGEEPEGTFDIKILPINDAPTIEAPLTASGSEAQPIAISGIVIADPDSEDSAGNIDADFASVDNMEVTLSVTSGKLNVTATDSSTDTGPDLPDWTGNDTPNLTITGTLADINATLTTLTYTGDLDFVGTGLHTDKLIITVKDGGNTGTDPDDAALNGITFSPGLTDDGDSDTSYEQATASVDITVNPVNDPPVNTVPVAQTVNEDTPLIFTGTNAITFDDPDIADNESSGSYTATVTLRVLHGTLTATADGSASVTPSDGSKTLTITGSRDDINNTLDGLSYQGIKDYYGSDTLTMVTSDQGNFGLGGVKTDTDTVAITVTAVNDAPTSSNIARSVNEDGTLNFTLPSSDVGFNSITDSQTVDRFLIISLPTDGVLTTGDDNLTLDADWLSSGDGLISKDQATNMTFEPDDNFNGEVSFKFKPVDSGNLESSAEYTATITVNAVNDRPTFNTDASDKFDDIDDGNRAVFTEGSGDNVLGTAVLIDIGENNLLSGDIELFTAENGATYAGTSLSVQRNGSIVSTDRFGLAASAFNSDNYSLTVAGTNVLLSGTGLADNTIVATLDEATDTNGLMVITFTDSTCVDAAIVNAVMQRITYNSIDDNSAAVIEVKVTFDDAGKLGSDPGTSGTESSEAVSGIVEVAISASNDSPSFEQGATITAREDFLADPSSDKLGETVADLLASYFTDPDSPDDGDDDFAGIAITVNDSTQGTWQYILSSNYTGNDTDSWVSVGDIAMNTALFLDTTARLRFNTDANANNTTFALNDATPSLTVKAVDNSTGYTSGTTIDDANGGGSALAADAVEIIASILPVNDAPAISNLNDNRDFVEAVGVDVVGLAVLLDSDTVATLSTEIELLPANHEDTFAGATITVQNKVQNDDLSSFTLTPNKQDYYVIQTGSTNISFVGTPIPLPGSDTQVTYGDGAFIKYDGVHVATLTGNSIGTGILTIEFNDKASATSVNAILQNLAFTSDDPSIADIVKLIDVTFRDGNDGAQGEGGELSASATVNMNLLPTNDAPALTEGATITTSEDTPTTATAIRALLDVGKNFIDPDGTPDNTLIGVAVSVLNNNGLGEWWVELTTDTDTDWFKLSDTAMFGTISESNALLLDADTQIKFIPADNANTDGLESTAVPYLQVHAVEELIPVGATNDSTGEAAVAIDTNSTSTALKYYDTIADTPEARVAVAAVTIDVQIAAVNDAPTLTASGSTEGFTEGVFTGTLVESPVAGVGTTPPQQLLTNVTVADLDLATTANLANDVFGAGTIKVTLLSRTAGDVFSLDGTFGTAEVVASTAGGTADSGDFVISLSTDATVDDVTAILQAIRYEHTSDNPPESTRSYTITLSDGDNSDGTDTASGLAAEVDEQADALIASLSGSIEITLANDPPVLSDTALSITQIEDDGSPSGTVGTLVADLVGGINDVDNSSVTGIAIVGDNQTNGTWSYSIDNGTTWTTLAATSEGASRLIEVGSGATAGRVYFQPNANYNGSTSDALTIRAWDTTDDSINGGVANITTTGAGTAYSIDKDTVNLTIAAVNDAPEVNDLDATSANTFIEGIDTAGDRNVLGTAIVVDADVSIFDREITDRLEDDFTDATLTVARSTGASAEDVLGFVSGTVTVTGDSASGTLNVDSTDVATYTYSEGTLTITFLAAAESTDVNAVAQAITYANSSDTPSATVTLSYEFNDNNESDAQGSGGSLANDATTIVVKITASNDMPLAVDDTHQITEDSTSISGNVLTGVGSPNTSADSDPESDDLTVTDIRTGTETGSGTNGTVNGSSELIGAHGTLVIATDGSYTYTLDNTDTAVNELKDDDSLTDYFTYTNCDSVLSDTAQLTITINGNTDGTPAIIAVDGNGEETGQATVYEVGLTSVVDTSESTTGTMTLSALDGLTSITVAGTTVTRAQLLALVPESNEIVIDTGEGTLTLTGYTSSSEVGGITTAGTLSYSYTIDANQSQPGATESTDTIVLSILDEGNATTNSNLEVRIVDDAPTAEADAHGVLEGTSTTATTTTGNVFSGTTDGDVADRIGADSTVTPVTGISFNSNDKTVGVAFDSAYGSLIVNNDGSYTYSVDNTNTTLDALDDGDTLTETFVYTITDTDGDISNANLVITITGTNDAPVLSDTVLSITQIEDDGAPVNGVTTGSTLVFDLVGGISDVDGSSVAGIAIVDDNQTNGIWYFSTDNGSTWTTLDATSEGAARLIAVGSGATAGRVYFQPDAHYNGDTSDALTIRGWDTTTESNGGTANITTIGTGADTAYSTATDTVNLTIAAVNDAPEVNGLDATSANTFIEGIDTAGDRDVLGTAIVVDADVTIFDREITDRSEDDFTDATLTVVRSTGANAEDILGFVSGTVTVAGDSASGTLTVDSADVATYTYSNGTLTITFNSDAESADVNAIAQAVTYANSSDTPPVTVTLSYEFNDNNDSDAQGSGGSLTNDATTIVVNITASNDMPLAVDDTHQITEDELSITGNVLTGVGSPSTSADSDPESDSLTVTDIRTGTEGGSGDAGTVDGSSELAGVYGTLVIGTDGIYTYTLDNTKTAVNELKDGDSLTDYFTYTNSDSALSDTAQLTITINGNTDGTPAITAVDGNAGETGQATVSEVGLTSVGDTSETTSGTVTISAPDGLTSITVGGTTVSRTQLAALGDTPVVIDSGEGTLSLTGYTSSSNVGGITTAGTLTYSYTLDTNQSQPGATESTDTIALSILDEGNATTNSNLEVRIIDDAPTAAADAHSVLEGTSTTATTTSGNVFSGTTDGDVADRIGADSTSTPVTGISFNSNEKTVGVAFASAYGSLTVNSDGSYTYSVDNTNTTVEALDDGDTLAETFVYTITDNDGDTSNANLVITITGTNDAPTVVGTISDISQADSTIVNIATADNFTDLDSDNTFEYSVTDLPTGLTINSATGVISGTIDHRASQGGTDGVYSVVVTATDSQSADITQSFDFTVTNPAPVANADTAAVAEDATLSVVEANGVILSGSVPAGIDSDIDGDTITVIGVTTGTAGNVASVGTSNVDSSLLGTYGHLTLNANGSYSYVADTAAADALGAEVEATDTFSYAISDGDGGEAFTTLTITITGTNDAPTAVGTISDISQADSTIVNIAAAGNFTDLDSNNTFEYSATGLPDGLTIDSATGVISGTIDHRASQGGTDGVYSFVVTATDSEGEEITQSFDFTVTNPAPVANADTAAVAEDATLSVLEANGVILSGSVPAGIDSDIDGDTITVIGVTTGIVADVTAVGTEHVGSLFEGTYGHLTLNANGSYSYVADTAAADALGDGITATDTFSYAISDGDGGEAFTTLTITITGTNDAPTAVGTISDISQADSTIVNIAAAGNFTDLDSNNTFEYSATGLPDGLTIDSATGVISGTIDHRASQGGTDGVYSVVVTATDSEGEEITQSFDFTVTNPAPVANADTAAVAEDATLSVLEANGVIESGSVPAGIDSDVDGDTITVIGVTTGTAANVTAVGTNNVGSSLEGIYGHLTLNADGSYSYVADTAAADALGEGVSATDTFSYAISDGDGGEAFTTLIITVTGTNNSAIISGTSTATLTETDEAQNTGGVLSLTDTDTGENAFTAQTNTAGSSGYGKFSIDVSGVWTYTMDTAHNEFFDGQDYTDSFTVFSVDGTASQIVTVTITGTNDAPSATNDTKTVIEDTATTLNLDDFGTFSDPDSGDSQSSVVIVTLPVNGTLTLNGTEVEAGDTISVSDLNDDNLVYTPAGNDNADESLTFKVKDADGTESDSIYTLTLDIIPVDDPATVTAGEGSTFGSGNEDTTISGTLLVSDDADGLSDGSVFTVTSPSTNGNASINAATGAWTYDANADYNGADQFTVTITDDDGNTSAQIIALTVNAVVDIAADSDNVDEDSSVTTNVLDNDSFENTPNITSVTQGTNGLVTIVDAANGTVSYTPNADFTGTDSYKYTVTSGGVTEEAMVTVTVKPVADIAADSVSVDEDSAVTINVLDNDSYQGVYGTDYEISSTTDPANGSVTIENDGTISYTPDGDFTGTDSFDYTVSVTNADGSTTTETATVIVTVNPVADIATDSVSVDEDSAGTINVLDNDSYQGVYGTDYAVTAATDPANGSVTIENDGKISYTPDADFNGTDSFDYTVSVTNADGSISTETATTTVTVNPVADIAVDSASVDEDGSTTDNLLSNDNFEGTPLITTVTQGEHGSVEIIDGALGTVKYTSNPNYSGEDSYTYTVTSGGVTETAIVSVSVAPVGDIAADNISTEEDNAVTIDVLANDTFQGTYGSDYEVTAATDPANGSVTIENDGTISYTPDADFNGTDSFDYTVSVTNADGSISTETATTTVTVTAVVDIADDLINVDEDGSTTDNLLSNDNFEGTPLITSVTQGEHGTVEIIDGALGTVKYTPNENYSGEDSYTYTVTSGGVTETATVSVTVAPVGDIAADSISTEEDNAVTIDVLANDTFQGTYGSDYEVTAATDPANGSVTISTDGKISYTPDADFTGTDSFDYTVSVTNADGSISTETATTTVTVNPVADIAVDSASVDEDGSTTDNLLSNDNFEGTPLITSVTQGEHGTVEIIDGALGTVKYTPDENYSGEDSYTYTVTSGGVTETAMVTVTVKPLDAPLVDDEPWVERFEPEDEGEDEAETPPAPVVPPDSLGTGKVVPDVLDNPSAEFDAGLGMLNGFDLFYQADYDLVLYMDICDQAFEFRESFSFQVPENTFTINVTGGATLDEVPQIHLRALLADGSQLPSWLSFDPETATFTGTSPDDTTVVEVKVIATTNDGQEAEAVFTITVQPDKGQVDPACPLVPPDDVETPATLEDGATLDGPSAELSASGVVAGLSITAAGFFPGARVGTGFDGISHAESFSFDQQRRKLLSDLGLD